MLDEVNEKTMALCIKGGKISAQILKAALTKLLAEIEAGTAYYDLVEVMTCKTGCVGGAGQPYGLLPAKHQRAEGLYEADRTALIKRSERNPIVGELLAGPLKGRTHELLHVHY